MVPAHPLPDQPFEAHAGCLQSTSMQMRTAPSSGGVRRFGSAAQLRRPPNAGQHDRRRRDRRRRRADLARDPRRLGGGDTRDRQMGRGRVRRPRQRCRHDRLSRRTPDQGSVPATARTPAVYSRGLPVALVQAGQIVLTDLGDDGTRHRHDRPRLGRQPAPDRRLVVARRQQVDRRQPRARRRPDRQRATTSPPSPSRRRHGSSWRHCASTAPASDSRSPMQSRSRPSSSTPRPIRRQRRSSPLSR